MLRYVGLVKVLIATTTVFTALLCASCLPAIVSVHESRALADTHYVSVACRLSVCCALTEGHNARCWGGNVARYRDASEMIRVGHGGDLRRVYGSVRLPVVAPSAQFSAVARLQVLSSAICLERSTDGDPSRCYEWTGAVVTQTNSQDDLSWQANVRLPPGFGANVREREEGDGFACLRTADGEVWCWGSNESGQLGSGDFIDHFSPVRVIGIHGATSLGVGSRSACATQRGEVWCWGDSSVGRIHATRSAPQCELRSVSLPAHTKDMVVGWGHSCALLEDHSVYCWGLGTAGQLTETRLIHRTGPDAWPGGHYASLFRTRSSPVRIGAWTDAESLIAGDGYSCVVEHSRTLCWGGLAGRRFHDRVREPQVGPARDWFAPVVEPMVLSDRAAADVATAAQAAISSVSLVRHIATDVDNIGSCVLRGESTIWCEFPSGSQHARCPEFALPVSAGPIVGMAVSQIHACAWTRLGAAFCMGYNSFAQLGESERVASRPRRVF